MRSRNPGLQKEEDQAFQFLKSVHSADVARFWARRAESRKGILLKLANSIIRENIDDLYSGGTIMDGSDAYLRRIMIESGDSHLQKERTYLLVQKQGNKILFPVINKSAFRFVEVDVPLLVEGQRVRSVCSAAELVFLLFNKEDYPNRDTFVQELNNGTANLALALTFHEGWEQTVLTEAADLDVETSIDYVLKKGADAHLFFEQLVVEGHHLHPGAKTKIGLTYEDTFRYSPEFHQTFPIRLAAVKKSLVWSTGATFESSFPESAEAGNKELKDRGYEESLYTILPVHPWQFEHAIPEIYQKEIENEEVILLSSKPINAEATSSFRTVAPKRKEAPVLKLAVNSQMTSTVRSISTQTAMNSTVFSQMIREIKDREPQLRSFVPLNEWGGAAFHSEERLKSRNLTMLIRESLHPHLENGEVAVAGMSLYARSPISGLTILHELVQEFQTNNHFTRTRAAKEFFCHYIQKVLPGYMTMMVKYGVALEGHLQNSLPVFKNGRLTRFFFRDWGGARVYAERLRKQGISPKFAADSVSVTNDRSSMHNKLYYTVFQNHLGEIIRQLVQYSGLPEKTFWVEVKKVVKEELDRLSLVDDLAGQVAEDRTFLFQPTVMHKSLTQMRLSNSKGDAYTEVPNPLA
ncbi:IucA/IucC family siderophore biosynthesis protein [Halobacillus litoralis]|uniref:IucA/IucC family siderophore biosynthesis protein n=2 Tax=Halobacillus litoralis TaxID=45668 RepID=A0A845E2U1_9BACI|nr:IucA/IucC family siderophore biosynthesis protein [Halobacillus litoralis]